MRRVQPSKGFTLIELIITISLMGIMVAIVGAFMSRPFEMYDAQSTRANLVTIVTSALVNMKRDVTQAVPNSIRVSASGNISALEFMSMVSGGRYRYTTSASDDTGLSPSLADSVFHSLGNISALPGGSAVNRLIVNPLDTTRLYEAATDTDSDVDPEGIITPILPLPVTTITHTANEITLPSPEDKLELSASYQFDIIGNGSERKRFYITDTPILYRCDTTSGELRRYRYYTPSAVFSTAVPTGATPATGTLVMNDLSYCDINFDPGSAVRSGVVTITLGATIDGENARMVQQLKVSNSP